MKKKFLSILTTGAMLISSSVVAFAEPNMNPAGGVITGTGDVQSMDIESTLKDAAISVAITGAGTAQIKANPYQLNVNGSYDSLIGDEYKIENKSDCEVELSLKGSIAVSGAVKVATTKAAAEASLTPMAYVQAAVKDNYGGFVYQTTEGKTKITKTDGTDEQALPVVYAAKAATYGAEIVMERNMNVDGVAGYRDSSISVVISGGTGGAGWVDGTDKFTASTVISISRSTKDPVFKASDALYEGLTTDVNFGTKTQTLEYKNGAWVKVANTDAWAAAASGKHYELVEGTAFTAITSDADVITYVTENITTSVKAATGITLVEVED